MEDIELFFIRLMALPLAEWYASATVAARLGDCAADHALTEAVSTPAMLFSAWLVRDRVSTAWQRFESPEGRRVCPGARVHEVKVATERAAQALLVRSCLCADDFRALYGGFARSLPV